MPEMRPSPEANKGRRESDPGGQISEETFFVLLVCFAFGWTAFVLLFDYVMWIRDTLPQLHTFHFLAVEGRVVKCVEKVEADGDGTTTSKVDIEYSYRFANQVYTGSTIRYADYWTNLRVPEFVANHPMGKAVTVFCDPDNPSAAVLEAGFDGRDLFLPLILLPFNAQMIGFWCLIVVGLRNGGRGWSKLSSGIRRIKVHGQTRIRIPGIAPAAAGLYALWIMPVAVTIGVGFLVGVPKDPGVAASAWGVVLGSFVTVVLYFARRAGSGEYDLIIDHVGQTLTVSSNLIGTPAVLIPLDDLLLVDLVSRLDPEYGRLFSVGFEWRQDHGEVLKRSLATSFAREAAQELVEWIQTDWPGADDAIVAKPGR
jgi:hypothetical protein